MNDTNKKSVVDETGSEAIAWGVLVIAVTGVVLWTARLPAFVVGALTGLSMVSNFKRRPALIKKVKAFIGTGVAVYFFLYTCFGLQGFIKSDFTGGLVKFDWYQSGVYGLVNWWNGFIPEFTRKWLWVNDKMITAANISHFIFTSVIAGTVTAIIVPVVFRLIKPQKETYSYDPNGGFKLFKYLAEFPYAVFRWTVEEPLLFFTNLGHTLAVKTRRGEVWDLAIFLTCAGSGIGLSYLFSKLPAAIEISSTEITFLVGSVIAYAPVTFFILGFILGLIPVAGDSVLYHLFDSAVPDVSVVGVIKKSEGFRLGNMERNKPFLLTESNLAYHAEIVAPTGSGKTNILKNLIADRIEKGHGIIFLDYKADFEVLSWMYRVAMANKRTDDLRLISLANPELSVPYNPLEGGTSSELTSRLMNAFEWSSEQYYLNTAKSALSRVLRGFVEYRDFTKNPFHVGHIHLGLTDSKYLRKIADILQKNKRMYWADLFEVAEKIDKPSEAKELRGLISNLETLMFSSVGALLTTDTESGSYSLKEAIGEGRITYCLMNSLLLKESSRALGKLFLQDLMSFVGRRFATIDREVNHNKPVTLIIDEFAAFAIPEFVDFLDRARSAGISVIIAHQDRADLKSISEEFQSRVEANTNTTIVSGVKDPKDAEHFAGMMGTKTVVKETWQESSGFFWDNPTGVKSKRHVDEYIIHPNRIKQLKQGEVLAIARTVDPHFGIVWVPKANEFEKVVVDKRELVQSFKETRAVYLKEENCENAFSSTARLEAPGLRVQKNTAEKNKTGKGIWG